MGAWGAGAFENDDAMDWVYELEQARDAAPIFEALERAAERDNEYLEAPEGNVALAAAEVVAALKGDRGPDLPDEAERWIGEHDAEADRETVEPAARAAGRIRNGPDSELKELWEESEHSGEWYEAVDDLLDRLKQ